MPALPLYRLPKQIEKQIPTQHVLDTVSIYLGPLYRFEDVI